jgi:type IV pilus assembly protein PilY1
MKTFCSSLSARPARLAAAIVLATASHAAFAAATDIATAPLFTSSSSSVKPNVMFILDDSGSMKNDYMPDDANMGRTKYAKSSYQCNGVAYNPTVTYALPVDASGNTVAAGSLSVLNPNPNDQTTNQRGMSAPATLIVPTAAGTDVTITVSGNNPRNSWYSAGDVVTLFSTDDSTAFIVGTVKSWSNNTRALVITVGSSNGATTFTTNLRVGDGEPVLPIYYKYSGSQTALGYTYTSSGVIKTTDFYKECNSTIGSTPGSSVFTSVLVTTASTEAQNYANWYAYYRTRISMAKSAISRAFKPLGDRYRVGYSTIGETGVTDGNDFVNVGVFDATQKGKFYTALNAASPSGYTPLRGALSKAGRYFANKAPGQSIDPVQYSCQKNFTILSTDGYWNTHDEGSNYGAFDVNGVNVGQRDGTPTPRPRYDGGSTITTRKITWDKNRTQIKQTDTTTTQYSAVQKTVVDTYTPQAPQSNNKVTSYTLGTIYNTVSNNNISRTCSGSAPNITCTVTVTPASMTGYAAGQSVTVATVTPTTYNGTFTILSTTGSTYSYTISGLSSTPTTPSGGSRGTSFSSPVGCPAGQGQLTTTVTQTDKFNRSSVSSFTATATNVTTRTQTQTVIATPYTQTITFVDGTQTADTGAIAGTTKAPVVTSLPALPDVVGTSSSYSKTDPAVPTTNVSPPAYTPAVLSNTTSCAATKPGNTTTTATAVASVATVTTGPTASTLAATPVSGPTTSTTSDDNPGVDGTKTTVDTNTTNGGSVNTLADVAAYYFDTDLRDESLGNCTGALGGGSSVCGVKTGTNISNPIQNMTTFTVGLGVNGTLKYDKKYIGQAAGDFYDLTQGSKNWPVPTVSDSGGDPTNIDDLWHAAVNGRGQYFSAGDPAQLVESLTSALLKIEEKVGAASAAATSTLQPVDGDNDVFVAQFTSAKWVGDLQRYSIDPKKGTISTTFDWSASAKLTARDLSTTPRKIYYFKPSGGTAGTLQEFTYANITADGLNGNFDNFCSKTGVGGGSSPLQCDTIIDKTEANKGSNLVNYLRGEAHADYRPRDSRLGDIINGAPIFVGAPKFRYTENGYASFASSKSGRDGVVYVAANDGMLHAFDRLTGEEKWAYIPSMMIPNLYKLADTAYANNHQFFVDGSPQVGDIYVGGAWKTILVGGLNAGGRAYYALDITDPNNPVALWEFSNAHDANLGLTFGNPIITKRAGGTWVVVFASGYNNTVGGGNGNGHLFVLNADTGVKLTSLPTLDASNNPVGSTGTPSGLAKINAWIDSEIDNSALRFYGGDLLGNMWRFDIDNRVAPNGKALRLAQLVVSGKAQPITTKPALAEVDYLGTKYAVVYVGTGKYLGTGDLSNTDQQSVYAFKDKLTATPLGDLRTSGTMVTQTLTTTTNANNDVIRKASTNKVDWSVKDGWMVDLPSSGERVNVNMVLALNVLSVASNIPSDSACDVGGTSWLYRFDIGSGAAISNAVDGAAGILLGNVLVAGQTVVQLQDGSTVTISTLSDAKLRTDQQPPPTATGALKRTSWRELAN